MIRITTALVVTSLVAACSGPGAEAPGPAAGSTIPTVAPVNDTEARYYRLALEKAARFERRPIPHEMLRTVDLGNDAYVVAWDEGGELLGYLRDFSGPVTAAEECECAPLKLTLVFDAERKLLTLLAPAPLTKKDHEPFTPEDMARLIDIARNPSEKVARNRMVESVVDATTGATTSEYKGKVVELAGLTTQRVVRLVSDTQKLLVGAPVAIDQRRLMAILSATEGQSTAQASRIARLIPDLQSTELASDAHRLLSRTYAEILKSGGTPLPPVEARLMDPQVDPKLDGGLAADACYRLVEQGQRLEVAERCAVRLVRSKIPTPRTALARLWGALQSDRGNHNKAVRALRAAVTTYDVIRHPTLHQRLSQSLAASGDTKGACAIAQQLYLEHPLLPGARDQLETCGEVEAVVAQLEGRGRQTLLSSRRRGAAVAPVLPVENDTMQPHDLNLAGAGKVTVLAFFATWCPHCQHELPKLAAFAERVAKDPGLSSRVQVLGIRTSVEKETENYEAFKKRLPLPFAVWTDPVMSMAFAKFARGQNLPTALPTLAVLDAEGRVAYVLPSGTHRDLERDLSWVIEDLTSSPSSAPAAADG